MKRYVAIIFITSLIFGCGVRVKTEWGFMGPDVYVATDGKIEVRLYNGNCCCVAKEVLESLAENANNKEFDWKEMSNKEFQDKMVSEECSKQKKEHGYSR